MAHIGKDVEIAAPAFIHDTACLYGKVHLAEGVSIWANVVMRAEVHAIHIGQRSNIQDFVMIHVGSFTPTIVGEECSITHHATLHGCEIGDRCLIGINATIMDGAKIGANSIVAGHTLVTEGQVFPDNSVIAGTPAKCIATRDSSAANLANAAFYSMIAANYQEGNERLSPGQIQQLLASNPKARSEQ